MTPRQWVAHAGLDPRILQSGLSLNVPARISKIGNRNLRAALFMPALVAKQHEPHVQAFYEKLIAKQKAPMQAVVAVMRKLLHAIYGMLQIGTDFDGQKFLRHAVRKRLEVQRSISRARLAKSSELRRGSRSLRLDPFQDKCRPLSRLRVAAAGEVLHELPDASDTWRSILPFSTSVVPIPSDLAKTISKICPASRYRFLCRPFGLL